MTKAKRRPIVITGCPRSGTTWVGTTVGDSDEVLYLYEPFNDHAPHHVRLPERYIYVPEHAEKEALGGVAGLLRLGSLRGRLRLAGRAARLGSGFRRELPATLALRELWRFPRSFARARRACIKDPLAFFAAEWLALQHDAQVVVTVRHPAGMVSSYIKLDWPCEVESLLRQPGLRAEFTAPLSAEIERFRTQPEDRLGGLILQWKIFAQAAVELHRRHPEWLFVSHEALCESPVAYFRKIFDYLNLNFSDRIERKILADTTAKDVDPLQHQQHALQRDSRALAGAWQRRLDAEAIDRIERETGDLWQQLLGLSWKHGAPLPGRAA